MEKTASRSAGKSRVKNGNLPFLMRFSERFLTKLLVILPGVQGIPSPLLFVHV